MLMACNAAVLANNPAAAEELAKTISVGVEAKGNGLSELVRLVPSRIGPSLQVHLTPDQLGRITPHEPYRLDLVDKKGFSWKISSFYFFETVQPLKLTEEAKKIITAYGSEETYD